MCSHTLYGLPAVNSTFTRPNSHNAPPPPFPLFQHHSLLSSKLLSEHFSQIGKLFWAESALHLLWFYQHSLHWENCFHKRPRHCQQQKSRLFGFYNVTSTPHLLQSVYVPLSARVFCEMNVLCLSFQLSYKQVVFRFHFQRLGNKLHSFCILVSISCALSVGALLHLSCFWFTSLSY